MTTLKSFWDSPWFTPEVASVRLKRPVYDGPTEGRFLVWAGRKCDNARLEKSRQPGSGPGGRWFKSISSEHFSKNKTENLWLARPNPPEVLFLTCNKRSRRLGKQ